MCCGKKKTLTESKLPQHAFLSMGYGFQYILARKQKDKPSSMTYQLTKTIWIFNINQGKWPESLQVIGKNISFSHGYAEWKILEESITFKCKIQELFQFCLRF